MNKLLKISILIMLIYSCTPSPTPTPAPTPTPTPTPSPTPTPTPTPVPTIIGTWVCTHGVRDIHSTVNGSSTVNVAGGFSIVFNPNGTMTDGWGGSVSWSYTTPILTLYDSGGSPDDWTISELTSTSMARMKTGGLLGGGYETLTQYFNKIP
jgi:hypothetical protein